MIKLDNQETLKIDCEIVSQSEQFKRYYLVESMVLKKGHTPFYLDLKTGEIGIVPVTAKVAFHVKKKTEVTHKEASFSFDKLYVGALNADNAEKHFNKMLSEIREKASFMRKNQLLDVTKHEMWPLLQKLGFTDFIGEKETAVGITIEIEVIGKGKETISICSIYPKVMADSIVWYFFEMVGGYAKIKSSALCKEACVQYTLEAFARFEKIAANAPLFTKECIQSIKEKHLNLKELCQQL